jgi:hypothetical protein
MIYITFKGVEYAIPYDIDSLKINRAIDSTFDNGYFVSVPLEASSGLDFSRRIPRNLLVRITQPIDITSCAFVVTDTYISQTNDTDISQACGVGATRTICIENPLDPTEFTCQVSTSVITVAEAEEDIFYFKTGETYVDKVSYGIDKYVHRVNLISLSKDLTRKPLENITLTQPKGDFGQYSRSINVLDSDEKVFNSNVNDNVWSANTLSLVSVPFLNTVNSNLSKLNGLAVVSLEEFSLNVDIVAYNTDVIAISQSVQVDIKYGGSLIKRAFVSIPRAAVGRPTRKEQTINFKYTPAATNSFSVEIQTTTSLVLIGNVTLNITALEVVSQPVRTYAQLVDKMLNRSEYVLSPNSRSRLSITAAEGKYETYSLYDALNKIGGELGALIRVNGMINEVSWRGIGTATPDLIGNSTLDFSPYDYPLETVLKVGERYYWNVETGKQRREVGFEFFDRPNVFDPIGETDRAEKAELEDFVSAVELNTKNIIKPIRYSPFRDGWKSLRSLQGIGQLTTENIGYETEDRQERIINVKVRGLASRNAANTVTWSTSDFTDITERVLEKRQYDTLPSESDYSYTGKTQLLKNNCLYYIQGDNKIYGMSYTGEHPSTLIGQPNVVRALYETILATRSTEIEELVTRTGTQANDDSGLPGDLLIQMQITYANQTESRARVYKDDQSGFETELIKYINESANVNESESIGNYAQQIVNRLGGTKVIVEGIVASLDLIAKLGDVDSQGRVYTLIDLKIGRKIEYTYTLVQDYNVISSYIGIQSRHRIEEVSSESTVTRTLRYTSKFIFTDTQESFTTRLINSHKLLDSLISETSDGVTYGYLECNLSNGEQKKIHLSVDSDNKGKTIEIKWGLQNNFSAGLKRYSVTRGSNTLWLNSDVSYVDYFGKVNDILFSIYYDTLGALDTDLYPEAITTDGDEALVTITDTIDKDALEVINGLVEIPILSESSKIRVYNGFARWNRVVEGTDRIRACVLHYVPIRNANKVDITRITDVAVTGTSSFGKLNLSFTNPIASQGLAFYNIDTLDLVLVYVENFTVGAKNLTLYYKVVDSAFGGGQNITQQAQYKLEVGGFISGQGYQGVSLTGDIYASIGEVLGQDAAITVDLALTMGGQLNVSFHQGVSLTGDITVDQTHVLGLDANRSVSLAVSIGGSINGVSHVGVSLGGNINIDQSTDYSRVKWVSGGTSATVNQTCEDLDDVGNVKKTVTQAESCTFVLVNSYISSTNETNNQACVENAVRIVCVEDPFDPGLWACNVFNANYQPEVAFYETCTLIEVET